MRTIIAGSRDITDTEYVFRILDERRVLQPITEVVSGAARGVDTIGEEWARHNCIKVKQFPADWDRHGKAAGPIRNAEMAKYAEACIVIWDGKSAGSSNMIVTAKKLGLLTHTELYILGGMS